MTTRILRSLGLTPILAILLFQMVSAEIIKKYDPAENRQDLLILGLGELTFHALDVTGNVAAFERGNPWLKDEFSSNYRASIFANGHLNSKLFLNSTAILDSRVENEYRTADPSLFRLSMSLESTEPLWDGWRFTGKGVYDPNRQWEFSNLDTRLLMQPQEPSRLQLMARLESEKNGYIEGGSLHSSFGKSQFTLKNRSIFGLFADLQSGPVGIEAVAGKMEGKAYREGSVVGIRANGTAGPYDLSSPLVTRGSEVVKIEVRDRFDTTTVISSRTLVRDIDYEMDYLRGRILLYQPVASETAAANPNYIVITYDYQRTADDKLLGSRLRLMPFEGVEVGASLLHRNSDNLATNPGIDEPDDLYSADVAFNLKKIGDGYIEIAQSEDDLSNENQAIRAGFKTKVIERLSFAADFMKIDDSYKSFTNSDLNPVKNQRRFNMKGGFDLTENQRFNAGFRNTRNLIANGEFNSYNGRRDEKTYSLGYRNKMLQILNFGLNLERRDIQDRNDLSHENLRQQRLIADIAGNVKEVGSIDKIGYGFRYEHIEMRNRAVDSLNNYNTDQATVSASIEPGEGTRLSLSHKFRLKNNRDSGYYSEREDASFLNLRVQPYNNFSSLITAEYKRYTVPLNSVSFWQDNPYRAQWAANIAFEYLPFQRLKTLGKFGRAETESFHSDPDSAQRNTDDFILGQLTYFHTKHLFFSAESEYRLSARRSTIDSRGKIWDLGLRLNWNRDHLTQFSAGIIRRWQYDNYTPSVEINAATYILLINGSYSLGHGFFARASVKDLLLRESIELDQTHAQIEIGYENSDWYRVSIGYERIESRADLFPDRYYRGQGPFIRLVGNL